MTQVPLALLGLIARWLGRRVPLVLKVTRVTPAQPAQLDRLALIAP